MVFGPERFGMLVSQVGWANGMDVSQCRVSVCFFLTDSNCLKTTGWDVGGGYLFKMPNSK